jgi:hypothetical protein
MVEVLTIEQLKAAMESLGSTQPVDAIPTGRPPGAPAKAANVVAVCPDCGLKHAQQPERFCPICRYDFVSKNGSIDQIIATLGTVSRASVAGGSAVVSSAVPPSLASAVVASRTEKAEGEPVRPWQIHILVDCSLYTEPDPEFQCPADQPPVLMQLEKAEYVIGRRSESKGIFPDIHISDPGISNRHAKLLREADGALYFLDIGSTNGSWLNGNEAAEGMMLKLTIGDEITLGCWTRIKIDSGTK